MTVFPKIGDVIEFKLDRQRGTVTGTWPTERLIGVAIDRREIRGRVRVDDVEIVPAIEPIDVTGAPGRSGAGQRGRAMSPGTGRGQSTPRSADHHLVEPRPAARRPGSPQCRWVAAGKPD